MPRKYTYLLRTCLEDGECLHKGSSFRWPDKGPVSAPDWDPEPVCGGGLHGLPWGVGDPGLWEMAGRWVVWRALAEEVVLLPEGKAKAPRGEVVYSGDRAGALEYLRTKRPADAGPIYADLLHSDKPIQHMAGHESTLTAGHYSTLSAGNRSTLTAGHESTLTAGNRSTLTAGNYSTLTAGHFSTLTAVNRSTLTAGHHSTLTAGHYSTLTAGHYSTLTAGNESTLTAGYGSRAQAKLGSRIAIQVYDRAHGLCRPASGTVGIELQKDTWYKAAIKDGKPVLVEVK